MKKLILILLSIVLLTACGQIEENGKESYLVTKPKNLKDFTIIFEGDNITSEYKNLKFSPKLSAMPQGSILKELNGVKGILYLDSGNHCEILE